MANENSGITRAAQLAKLGHHGNLTTADRSHLERAVVSDSDPRARSAALGALLRAETSSRSAAPAPPPLAQDETEMLIKIWLQATGDEHATVRQRTAELGPTVARIERNLEATPVEARVTTALINLLADVAITVVEAAAWALGEEIQPDAQHATAVAALARTVTDHEDALAREAAVAALGARRDPAGLPAILNACRDKPAVRRRAVLALAPFTGAEVDQALAAAAQDRDPQVRQAAEILQGVAKK